MAVLALIFGILGLVRSKTRGVGKGPSIAALILAPVAIIGVIVSNVMFVLDQVNSFDRIWPTVRPLTAR